MIFEKKDLVEQIKTWHSGQEDSLVVQGSKGIWDDQEDKWGQTGMTPRMERYIRYLDLPSSTLQRIHTEQICRHSCCDNVGG
jgi:hypothetical protein